MARTPRYPGTAALIALAALPLAAPATGAESEPKRETGLKRIQLVTPATAIVPSEPLTVGLLLDPEPGFHTYWKGPGSIGVATVLEWDLPSGFEAGDILWPPPQRVDMAGTTAHGYEKETCLLTDIATPDSIEPDRVTLRVKAAWMACHRSCHPGVTNFTLTLPVHRSDSPPPPDAALAERFREIRASVPHPAPENWRIEPRLLREDRIALELTLPGGRPTPLDRIRFYSYDMQVDSDRPQRVVAPEGHGDRVRLILPRPSFAPADPDTIAGVLHHPRGWPGTDSRWVEISAPWPEDTFDQPSP